MNILFLSLIDFDNFKDRNIYTDLLRELTKNGHCVYAISPVEKRHNQKTQLSVEGNSRILHLKIGNTTKTNLIEKGVSILRLESQFIRGIKKYYADVKFDLVLYATPPVTFAKVIRFVKRRDGAKSYLMLKDIFPQNAVDLGMLSTSGIKGLIYHYFRKKEKQLYALSDRIGCMSPANCNYILKHNPEISQDKVEVFPNCIDPIDMRVTEEEKRAIRIKYELPLDKKIFVYGGNLGRPQDVPFIVECLKACVDITDAYFVIAGSGTDRHFLEEYMESDNPSHVKLFGQIPKEEYDRMIACCDVGLVFLDYRFTIPNFPSRLLAYMQAGLPILACTDTSTDIGKTITENSLGWWCKSDAAASFVSCMRKIAAQEMIAKTHNSWDYLQKNYNVNRVYDTIVQ